MDRKVHHPSSMLVLPLFPNKRTTKIQPSLYKLRKSVDEKVLEVTVSIAPFFSEKGNNNLLWYANAGKGKKP